MCIYIHTTADILKSIVTYTLLVCLAVCTACHTASIDAARQSYMAGAYQEAVDAYRSIYQNTDRNNRAMRGIISYEMAENYRLLRQFSRAASSYATAIRYQYPDTLMYLHYAQMLHAQGKYADAVHAYDTFLGYYPQHPVAVQGKQGAVAAQTDVRSEPTYTVRRMDKFNSRRREFAPLIHPKQNMLYFTSSRDESRGDVKSRVTGNKFTDLFVSTLTDKGEWQAVEPLAGEINTPWDEGVATFSADGTTMIYTHLPLDDTDTAVPQLYRSEFLNGAWTVGQPLDVVTTDSASMVVHPALSPRGDWLYFVSDMPGGYGGKDIWRVAYSPNRVLTALENLGSEVNTAGDELFPYVHPDGTLYFASDGHAGMGGLDVFRATFRPQQRRWRTDRLPAPINSSADDFGITFFANGHDAGFVSSNRTDLRGYDHIYAFAKQTRAVVVEGFVVDPSDTFVVGATIHVVGNDGSQRQFTTNSKGVYSYEALPGVSYVFQASAHGFLNHKQALHTSPVVDDTLYYVDFEMIPYHVPVVMEHIYYDFDKATLRAESLPQLDSLAELLHLNPLVDVDILAHTDRKGTSAYNMALSQRRAESVVSYLQSKGIDSVRLHAIGLGADKPLTISKRVAERYPFLSEEQELSADVIDQLQPDQQQVADQLNRRTEFVVRSREE